MKNLKISTRNNIVGWMFALPAVLGFLLLNLVPMLVSGYYSFCQYNVIMPEKWVGFQNYINLFTGENRYFWLSVKATGLYALMAVPANIIFAFMIALLLNRDMKGRTFFRTLFYMPCIVPAIANSFVWILLLNPDFGLLNMLLDMLHLPTSQFFWGKGSVLPSIVFMGIWATGSTQIIFLAGLQEIPRTYYEAAEIDGASAWQKLFSITLPMMSSTIFFNLVMGIISALQVFSQAYIITEGGPNNSSLFYVYNLWRHAFTYMEMGTACAMGWILFLVVMVLTVIVFRTSNKWVFYEGGE